jgi:hypothetical protein
LVFGVDDLLRLVFIVRLEAGALLGLSVHAVKGIVANAPSN